MTVKNALVIGSGGIGSALARRLAADRHAWRVLRADRSGSAEATVDVRDEATVRHAAAQLADRVSRLHLLIVATGHLHDGTGQGPEKRIEDLSPDALARSFAVNAIGPILVARHFLSLLDHDERAVFAALSARVGSIGDNRLGGWYGYRASKAALNQLVRTFAVECGRRARNLICVALHPGTVDSPLSAPFQGNVPASRLFTPDRSAGHLLDVIAGLEPGDSGGFFAWDGKPIDW